MPNWKILILILLIIFDLIIWNEVVFGGPAKEPEIYFLNVGQGDSELVVLPDNVKILIDGGPNNKVINELNKITSPFNRYVDLIILSHPQLDHFGGFFDVVRNYKIGAFIYTGKDNETKSFKELKILIKEKNIKTVILKEKDKINYQKNKFEILSPSKEFLENQEINDSALVIKFLSQNGLKVLFTGDIDKKVENYLVEKYGLKIDVLKVSHHGSKYSSTEEFLKEAKPKISIIEVGKNSYGHPTQEVLNRLSAINSKIFRTDRDGTIKISTNNQKINIFSLK